MFFEVPNTLIANSQELALWATIKSPRDSTTYFSVVCNIDLKDATNYKAELLNIKSDAATKDLTNIDKPTMKNKPGYRAVREKKVGTTEVYDIYQGADSIEFDADAENELINRISYCESTDKACNDERSKFFYTVYK
jgi:hypothetical protein